MRLRLLKSILRSVVTGPGFFSSRNHSNLSHSSLPCHPDRRNHGPLATTQADENQLLFSNYSPGSTAPPCHPDRSAA